MKVCVIGLGYIGLPTAIMFALHGIDVHGVDINNNIIKSLQIGNAHIKEKGLEEKLTSVIESKKLTVSTTPEKADVFIVTVPTPLTETKKVDLSYVIKAAQSLIPVLEKGNLIILESTVPPNTTKEIFANMFERSGFQIGKDLFIAYSPERVLPGRLFEELSKNDRVVGGIDEQSTIKAVNVYKTFLKGDIWMTDATTAELVKLIENTYRDVNIALVNELAIIAEKLNLDIWEAIKLANNHPRVHLHVPGPGVGGHCIAIDPWFIIEQAPNETKLISTARKVNESIPYRIVELIEQVVKHIDMPTITLLGLSYKANIDDIRESSSLVIYNELLKKNYNVKVHDPFIKNKLPNQVDDTVEAIKNTDCLVLLTDHDLYKNLCLADYAHLFKSKNIIDTRNAFSHRSLQQAGFLYYRIGTSLSLLKERDK